MRGAIICLLAVTLASSAGQDLQDLKNRTGLVGSPQIVARVNLTGQTNSIPTTTFFTPKSDGLFRLSGVMVTTLASNQLTGTWETTIGFTPDSGATTQPWVSTNTAVITGGVNESTLTVRSNAGNPLTYSVSVGANSGDPQGSTYELFLVLERLE